MTTEYLPLDDAAKELGVSLKRLEAQLADGKHLAFISLANRYVAVPADKPLPERQSIAQASCTWLRVDELPGYYREDELEDGIYYLVSGWLALAPPVAREVLHRGYIDQDGCLLGITIENDDGDVSTLWATALGDDAFTRLSRGMSKISSDRLYVRSVSAPTVVNTSQEKPLDTRERTTLHYLVAVLAEMASLDLKHPHAAAASVSKRLMDVGIDRTPRTIATKLQQAIETYRADAMG